MLAAPDDVVRIGYACGTRTHQRDFAVAAPAIARVIKECPRCRLVLFLDKDELPTILLREFPELRKIAKQVEWRPMVPLAELPNELARFDVNIAPLDVGNLFCEAKSELKFFEAAIAGVPTVASPTGPFRRAIRHGETGFLAATTNQWYASLRRLVGDPRLQSRVAAAAFQDVLWTNGSERRAQNLASVLAQAATTREAARALALDARFRCETRRLPEIPRFKVAYMHALVHE